LDDMAFFRMCFFLMTIGFAVSFACRVQNLSLSSIHTAALVIFVVVLGASLLSDQAPPLLAPSTVLEGERPKIIGVAMIWLTVFSSFMLTSAPRLLLYAVPSVALIALSCEMNTDPQLLLIFTIFVCFTIFLIIHETYLRTKQAGDKAEPDTGK